jgi:DNA-binding NarL/FixJ family response regulator
MRERADLMSGRLEIHSGHGAGTRVRLDVPLAPGPQRASEDVRVLLVEDHAAVREALAAAFEREDGFEIVGQAASLHEARDMLDEVDVAVLDLGLPDGYGGDLIADLREASPRAQALVLTATFDRADVARAVDSGAAGALSKTAHLHEVVNAVRRLHAGETLLGMDEIVELLRFARRRRDEEHADREAIERLTPREREVLQALAEGLDTRGVAERLHITIRTERNHIASILAKLGVHSQLQALVLSLRYAVVKIAQSR